MGSVGEKSTRILIVADKVQLFSQIIIVHLIGKSHIIVGDKMIRAVSADYLRLFLHKIHNQSEQKHFQSSIADGFSPVTVIFGVKTSENSLYS
mgnify:CR=1 FL=1